MDKDRNPRMPVSDTRPPMQASNNIQFPRNPRRCSPEESVSLRPSLKPEPPSSQSDAHISSDGLSSGPHVRLQKEPMRASPSQASASQWFKQRNENVQSRADVGMHESPFYLASHPNDSYSDDEGNQSGWQRHRFHSRDSENSDLRDVIDDLTVENQKLKQRLKKYEQVSLPDLQQDKMFELRVHGLSANKKKDLEDLLADFVTKVNVKDPSESSQPSSSARNPSSKLVSSSSHSRSQVSKPGQWTLPTDSAYASGPTSNPNSDPSSHHTSAQGQQENPANNKSREHDIRSYLHNIPESLLPRAPPVMSEKARKKLVVRKLEHLFTGRSAAPGPHSQPLQQQEVSRLAAQEGKHRFEGSREARIMFNDNDTKMEVERSPKRRKMSHSEGSDDSAREPRVVPGDKSPNQRPTRPLDLDIHRAQHPAENMEYIRHLGLPSPTRHNDDASEGWVYLNLLVNMAQLHTLNVTPEFIKRAVSDLSDKFELSPDGRRIRWKGGDDGTTFSSDSGSNPDGSNGSPDLSNSSHHPSSNVASRDEWGSKHASMSSSEVLSSRPLPSGSTSANPQGTASLQKSSSSFQQRFKASDLFDYKPVVLKTRKSSEESDEYYGSRSSSRYRYDDVTGRSSSHQTNSNGGPSLNSARSDAAIIFYKNSIFYSDLAGDPRNVSKAQQQTHDDSRPVLGIPPKYDDDPDSEFHQAMPMDEVRPYSPPDTDEYIPPLILAPFSSDLETHQDFQEFPVSGLGGVIPSDNFLIDVLTQHSLYPEPTGRRLRRKPRKTYTVIFARKLNLPPSPLPPPSYIFMPVTSSSSSNFDGTDSDDDQTDSSLDEDMPAPPTMMIQMSSNSELEDSPGEGKMDEDDEDEDTSSIDMMGGGVSTRGIGRNTSTKAQPDPLPAVSSVATAGYASDSDSPMSLEMGPPSPERD